MAGHDLAPEQVPAKILYVGALGHASLDDATKIVEAAERMSLELRHDGSPCAGDMPQGRGLIDGWTDVLAGVAYQVAPDLTARAWARRHVVQPGGDTDPSTRSPARP